MADPIQRETVVVPYGISNGFPTNGGITRVVERLFRVTGWMLALILCTLSLIQSRFREKLGGYPDDKRR